MDLLSTDVFDPHVNGKVQDMIPLFLCAGAVPVSNAVYYTLSGAGYSSYPVVCGSDMLPNAYFTLAILDSNIAPDEVSERSPLEVIVQARIPGCSIKEYREFKMAHHGKPTVYGLSTDSTSDTITTIIRDILNPLGIGAFYDASPRSQLSGFPFRGDVESRRHYIPVAYSEEMVRQMLMEHEEGDDDMDAVNVAALVCLKFPISPIILPQVDLARRRDRFVFFHMMLRNPPPFPGTNRVLDPSERPTVSAYQWVRLTVDGPSEGMKAVICHKREDPLVELLSDQVPKRYRVECEFVNGKAALMSPLGGYLVIEGRQEHTQVRVHGKI